MAWNAPGPCISRSCDRKPVIHPVITLCKTAFRANTSQGTEHRRLTKSAKLASELLTKFGLVCLRAAPLAGHPDRSKLAIGGIADRDRAGARIWFRNERDAKRVLDAFLSR